MNDSPHGIALWPAAEQREFRADRERKVAKIEADVLSPVLTVDARENFVEHATRNTRAREVEEQRAERIVVVKDAIEALKSALLTYETELSRLEAL